MIIEAARSGKDIFCEKPMAVSPSQGLKIVKAVNETRRVVQIGTQQRSIAVIREAKEKFIDSAVIGKVTMVHCYWDTNIGYIMPPVPPELQVKPADLDWENWLGSLPRVPWDPKRFIRPFLFWGPSTGPTGNLLIHFLDVIHWYLGIRKPSAAIAIGGFIISRTAATFRTTLVSTPGALYSRTYVKDLLDPFDYSGVRCVRECLAGSVSPRDVFYGIPDDNFLIGFRTFARESLVVLQHMDLQEEDLTIPAHPSI